MHPLCGTTGIIQSITKTKEDDYFKHQRLHKVQFIERQPPHKQIKSTTFKNRGSKGLNLFPYCPVIVYEADGKYTIIDGQHRFTASQELEAPIYYVVCERLSLSQIAKLNSNSTNWSSKNFLECYVKVGIKDYEDLAFIINKYKVAYAVAADMLMIGNCKSKGSSLNHFKNGTFKSRHFAKTCELLDGALDVFGRYEFWNHGYLIEAYRQLLETNKCDMEVLRVKIKQNPNILDKRGTVKEYLFNIERAYNDKNHKRVSIF